MSVCNESHSVRNSAVPGCHRHAQYIPFQSSRQPAIMYHLRQLVFLSIILFPSVFADSPDKSTKEKTQTEATQTKSLDTTGHGCTDNSPDSTCFLGSGSYTGPPPSQTLTMSLGTGHGCTDNSPDSTCFLGSGSYTGPPLSQTLTMSLGTGHGCTDNSPDSTCFLGSGSYTGPPPSQTLTMSLGTGHGCTDNSPDSTCFLGSGSYTGPPSSQTPNAPITTAPNPADTGIARPTATETHTGIAPCGNICGPVRVAEILCGKMHPNSNARFLDCVCASNNTTTPIGACAACKIAQGDRHDCKTPLLII